MKKIVAALSILGVAAMALPGHAVTIEEVMAQIAELQAQLVKLQAQAGVTVTGGCTFTRALYVGVRGDDVKCLQEYLMGAGYSIPAGPTNYYGAQTQAAVAQWQAANGVAPAAGYFGSISQAKYNSLKPSTPGTETPGEPEPGETGEGTEGYLEVKVLSVPNNVDLYDGEENVAVMVFDLKAKDSDITVRRIDLQLDGTPYRDFSYISLYSGSNALAGVKTSSYTKVSGNYRYRIDGLNLKVAKGTTETVTVKVSVLANPKNTKGTSYNLTLAKGAIRYTDSLGINDYNEEVDKTNILKLQGEEEGTLKVSLNSSSPDEGIVVVSEKSTTKDVELLVFDIQSKDIASTLDDVTVKFAGNNTESNKTLSSIISAVNLYSGSTLIGSERIDKVGDDYVAVFEDLGISLGKDVKKTFTVEVEIAGQDGNYKEGDYIAASIEVSAIVATNANDEEIKNTTALLGNDMSFYVAVPVISGISSTIDVTSNKDTGATLFVEGQISFTLTAEGDEIVIDKSGITIEGYCLDSTTTATIETSVVRIDGVVLDGSTSDVNRTIAEGKSKTIVATASINGLEPSASQNVYFRIGNITWGTGTGMVDKELERTETKSVLFRVVPQPQG